MTVDGVIFDIDGTIWDATDSVVLGWNRALEKTGDSFRIDRTINRYFGKTVNQIFKEVLPKEYSEEQRKILEDAIFKSEENALMEYDPVIYDGFIPVIKELYKKVPLFVVSNCQPGYLENMLKITGAEPYITDYAAPSHTGLDKPGNISYIAEKHHLKKGVYVGDTVMDKEATEKAGLIFIWASYGFGKNVDSSYNIESLYDLPELLEKI